MAVPQTGVLLLNVGTPDAATPRDVRRYLAEFLSDPRVVDLASPFRWLLVNGLILPFRPKKSAAAYQKVWTPEGSPLLVYSRAMQTALQAELGASFRVELGMRYGNPSLTAALTRLLEGGATEIVVLPQYPQYASSSTGSGLEAVYRSLARRQNVPALRTLPPFHATNAFLDAYARVARPVLEAGGAEHLLVSFHGLPERQIRRSDPSGRHCLKSDGCCDQSLETNRFCYRFQAFQTARALAARLGFGAARLSISFQSRLGRTPWIRPYTDLVVPALAHRGVARLGVICPSFVSDCLETLEEIGIRARASFVQAGGADLVLSPCLNADIGWVKALADWVRTDRLS